MVRLRRTSPSSPGWARVPHGRGFRYVDQHGQKLEVTQIDRCKKLVIPPAWTEVWICPADNGHLQAVGTDDAGRRQYLYHPHWRERRDLEKFERMEGFAASLLKHRAASRRDLGCEGLSLERVAATAFSLLDLGMFRIGSERYVEENGSYGLTTLDKQHVHSEGRGMTFTYAAKSGQDVGVTVRDERVREVLDVLRRRRGGGDRLLVHKTGGRWHDLQASDVNAYVKDLLGEDYSAKDFRTWRGTSIAALSLAGGDSDPVTSAKKSIAFSMREVSSHLGNTPAIARKSYVDPRVVDCFLDGVTVGTEHRRVSPGATISRALERDVLTMLKRA